MRLVMRLEISLPDGRSKSWFGPLDKDGFDFDHAMHRGYRHWKVNGRPVKQEDIKTKMSIINHDTGVNVRFAFYYTTSWNMELYVNPSIPENHKFKEFGQEFGNLSLEETGHKVSYFSREYLSDLK